MAYVDLPCDTEEWAEQKNVFIMLSRLRSLEALKLFVGSYTRADAAPSATSRCLSSLRGLVTFLNEYCDENEQNKFMKKTLPFIANSAAMLEDRVPTTGIPCLEKQENSSLVLGRKVVLSLLANAFFSAFPGSFNFKSFFDVFLEKSDQKCVQSAKLKAILCYFERASEGQCNLSGVITYRRKVLERSDMPTMSAWCGNPLPLCPHMVDNNLLIEQSGGQTLQVCFSSRLPGGQVLQTGSSMEEVRFCISPEALLVKLVMEEVEANEVIILTGTEKFADCTGSHKDLKFIGELKDESEHDVFGNMLNSFVSLDASSVPSNNPQVQYSSAAVLRDLNKAYTGFLCQEARGDINTEKLTLTVKRGSLAFAAEEYPAFSSRMNKNFAPLQGGAVHQKEQATLQLKISTSQTAGGDSGGGGPLSPIPESCKSPGVFQAALVGNILMGGVKQFTDMSSAQQPSPDNNPATQSKEKKEFKGGIEEFAARMACNLVAEGGQVLGERERLTPSPVPPIMEDSSGQDALASHLAATIINSSLGERMRSQAWAMEQEENRKNAEMTKEKNIQEKSEVLAKSIISDALFRGCNQAAGLPGNKSSGIGDDEITVNGNVEDSSMELASRLAGVILSEAVKTDTKVTSTTHPAIVVPLDRRGSIESFRSSRSSSLTGQSITVLDFTEEVVEEVVRDGLSMAQFMLQGIQGQNQDTGGEGEVVAEDKLKTDEDDNNTLASDIAYDVVQEGIEMFANCTSPLHVSKHEVQQPREIIPSFSDSSPPTGCHAPPAPQKPLSPLPPRQSKITPRPTQPLGVKDSEHELPMMASSLVNSGGPQGIATPMSQRLLTPLSVRTGYAWSTASTQDEESRPVSPMDMNKIGLSLTTNTEEFSSLVSEMVISHAIGDATGSAEPSLSPRNISSVDDPSVTNSSKIGLYLSQLGQAEPLCDAGLEEKSDESSVGDRKGNGLSSFSSLWDRMRLQLLRPITTGNWGCGPSGGADPQLRAMIQWVAASACGRPKLIYCTTGEDKVKQLSEVMEHLKSRGFTVGDLCQLLVTFCGEKTRGKAEGPVDDLFTRLLKL